MKRIKLTAMLMTMMGMFCMAAIADESSEPAGHVESKKYVTVRCLFGDVLLYEKEGSEYVHYGKDIGRDDLRAHWIVKDTPEEGAVWLVNRVTGNGMTVEGQTGFVEVAPLQDTFWSYRWKIMPGADHVFIQNAWQQNQYICLEDQDVDMAGYDMLQEGWWSFRFVLEPVAD